jgi:hypothetical protein
MNADKFVDDLNSLMESKPSLAEIEKWLDEYPATKADLAGVISYLVDCEKLDDEPSGEHLFGDNIRRLAKCFKLAFGKRKP